MANNNTATAKEKSLTTPKGVAMYPRIQTPDTKFDKDGKYSIKLKVQANDPSLKSFITAVKLKRDEALKQEEIKKKKKKLKVAPLPFEKEIDSDGNETGFVLIKAGQKAKIQLKSGETFEKRISIFDTKGNPIPPSVKIGGGSVCRLAVDVIPFFTDLAGFGVTLRLKAVRILELVEYQGESAETYFGNNEDEGSYTVNSAPAGENEGMPPADEEVPVGDDGSNGADF
jgi:hypothetical protein